MAVYSLKIAGITIRISLEWDIEVNENFLPFLCEYIETPMENIIMKTAEILPLPDKEPIWNAGGEGFTLLDGENYILHRLPCDKEPFSADVIHKDSTEILFRKASDELPFSINKVFNGLPFEGLLLRHGSLILHCSFIKYKDKAILFSAPSGTGKSTQAALWEKYKGADIINGDRAAVRKVNGIWRAYGIPLAGSSDIFRNESAPVGALVMLGQGGENTVKKLDAFRAFSMVYPEFSLFRDNKELLQQGTDLILDFLENIPAYYLCCRPDRDAVEILSKTLNSEV